MAIWDGLVPEGDLKMFEKAHMGPRNGFGLRPAVVVVDMSYAFTDDRYPTGCTRTGQPCIQAIKQLLDHARPARVPIFYTTGTHWDLPVLRGRWKTGKTPSPQEGERLKIVKELAPTESDVVIYKRKPSAFFGTDLVSLLNYHSVDTVIITGMVTSGCVRASVVDAFSYNYYVVVPEECVADRGDISHKIGLFDMHMKYADVIPLDEVTAYLDKLCVSDGPAAVV